eukprot:CAMPEP_0196729646 /NCGR_PEP_ID=MMETSP1091-20130531/9973_1 /TAXON_ID=302021 /ORGANISM="Rhodomonas sp., Strain CCMP768" /LENGTH=59 /DNA_ID=CAMNT_0042072555 /DNA_START=140 /DNA_END=319 /DNA_ORIENTATION=-
MYPRDPAVFDPATPVPEAAGPAAEFAGGRWESGLSPAGGAAPLAYRSLSIGGSEVSSFT